MQSIVMASLISAAVYSSAIASPVVFINGIATPATTGITAIFTERAETLPNGQNVTVSDLLIQTSSSDSFEVQVSLDPAFTDRRIGNIEVRNNANASPTVNLAINGSAVPNLFSQVPVPRNIGRIFKTGDGDRRQRLLFAVRSIYVAGSCDGIEANNVNTGSIGGDVLGVISAENYVSGGGGFIGSLTVNGSVRIPDAAPQNFMIRGESNIQNLIIGGSAGSASSSGPIRQLLSGGGTTSVKISGSFRGDFRALGVLRAFTAASVITDLTIVDGNVLPQNSDDGFVITGGVTGRLRFNQSILSNQTNSAIPAISLGSYSGIATLNGSQLGGTWQGRTVIGGMTLAPLPSYTSTIVGGGSFGFAPFDANRRESSPSTAAGNNPIVSYTIFNSANTTPVAIDLRTIRIRHYGPVFNSNTNTPQLQPAIIEYRPSGSGSGAWQAVSSGFEIGVDPADSRTLLVRPLVGQSVPAGEYRVRPISASGQRFLRCLGVTGLPPVNWDQDAFFFRVGCLTTNGNPNPADITGIGGIPNAIPDGQVTGDDFNSFINAFAAEQPTFVFTGNGQVYQAADITGIGGTGGPDGLITGDDFNAFIGAFASGCQ